MRPASDSWPRRHPDAFAGWSLVVVLIAYPLSQALFPPGFPLSSPLRYVPIALLAIVAISVLGWWRATGVRSAPSGPGAAYFYALLPCLFLAPLLGTVLAPHPLARVLSAATTALLIGFSEEALARGLVQSAFARRGARRAVVSAAVWYGLTHLLNLLAVGRLDTVALQIVRTTGTGVLWGAVRSRSGSLWPAIAGHAALDFVAALGGYRLPETLEGGVFDLALGPAFFLLGLALLRRSAGDAGAASTADAGAFAGDAR